VRAVKTRFSTDVILTQFVRMPSSFGTAAGVLRNMPDRTPCFYGEAASAVGDVLAAIFCREVMRLEK